MCHSIVISSLQSHSSTFFCNEVLSLRLRFVHFVDGIICVCVCVSLQQREISCLRLYPLDEGCVCVCEKRRKGRGEGEETTSCTNAQARMLQPSCPVPMQLFSSPSSPFSRHFHSSFPFLSFFRSLFAPFLLHFSACLSLYPFVITSSASYTAFRVLVFPPFFLVLFFLPSSVSGFVFWDSSLSLFPFPFLSVSIRFNASAYCEFRRKQIAAIFRLISSRQRLPLSIAHPTIHPSIPISPRVISPS